ncbi:MAG: hypothetical protein WA847_14335 [Terriglobales bacterium]
MPEKAGTIPETGNTNSSVIPSGVEEPCVSAGRWVPRSLPHLGKGRADDAKEDGVSLNQWIAAAVAQRWGVVETAADFFKKRAGKATGAGLMKFLRTAPKGAPEPEDEMR